MRFHLKIDCYYCCKSPSSAQLVVVAIKLSAKMQHILREPDDNIKWYIKLKIKAFSIK